MGQSIKLKDEQTALAVNTVSKIFHKPQQTLWQRIRGIQPTENANGKEPVIAVDTVTFSVTRGEIFGILGPNGSGKSTLIRVMCTLLTPDVGSVQIFGLDIAKDEMQVKQLISRVSVDAAFFKKLSPLENLLYGSRLYGVSGRKALDMAHEILDRLGLKKSSYTEPMEEMSRGMQQKVAIARAFLTTPVLLLLDEPTTGLDPRSKREVRTFVEELRDTHDATIIITTHDMEEAEALCDRIAVIHDGKIVALDTPDGLKKLVPDQTDPTLEDVFMHLTGEKLVKEEDEDEDEKPTLIEQSA